MSLKRQFKTEPFLLSKIKNLLEGYDGLAIMTAVRPKEGIFELIFTNGMSTELDFVIQGIGKDIPIIEIQS